MLHNIEYTEILQGTQFKTGETYMNSPIYPALYFPSDLGSDWWDCCTGKWLGYGVLSGFGLLRRFNILSIWNAIIDSMKAFKTGERI